MRPLLFWGWLLIMLIALSAVIVFRSSPVKKRLSEKEILAGNLICFGDSLTAGVGASPEESYPAVLKEKVPFPVVNAGVSGETTSQALSRLDLDVLSRNPAIVVVELGANDFLNGVPVKTAEENLTKIISKIKEKNSLVLLAGVNLNWEFNQMFRRLAKENGLILVPDILTEIIDNPELMSDSLHPDAQGYVKVAQIIYQGICQCLKQAGYAQILPEDPPPSPAAAI